MRKNPWTTEEDTLLKTHYYTKTKKELGGIITTRSLGAIKVRIKQLRLHKKVCNKVNQDVFETPNLVNCAYAGFLAADGCVTTKNRLSLCIAIKDLEYLKEFAQFLDYKNKIYYTTIKPRQILNNKNLIKELKTCSICTFQTPKLCQDLERNFSIIPRKTLILEPPKLVELDHILAFMSGEIDGDGWISWINNPKLKYKKKLAIYFLGTKPLLEWFKKNIDDLFPNDTKPQVRQDGKIYYYIITGNKAYVFCKMLLCLSIPRLDRKWDKAREYIHMVENLEPSLETKIKITKLINSSIITFLNKYNQQIPKKLFLN